MGNKKNIMQSERLDMRLQILKYITMSLMNLFIKKRGKIYFVLKGHAYPFVQMVDR